MARSILLSTFLILYVFHTKAQDESQQSRYRVNLYGKSMVIAGLETSTTSYIDTATKDSSGTALYLAAYINYYSKYHIGLKGKSYFLTKGKQTDIFLTELSVYYASYSKKLMPLISYTRFLQSENTSVPFSPLKNEIFLQLRYAGRWLEPAVGFDWGFGRDKENNNATATDLNSFLNVSHWFIWQRKAGQSILAVPTIQLNAGTDRYFRYTQTSRYISKNRSLTALMHGRNVNRRGGMQNGMITGNYILNEENEFSLSNLEFNGYLQFSWSIFSIAPSASIYLPLRGDDRQVYGYWQLNFHLFIN